MSSLKSRLDGSTGTTSIATISTEKIFLENTNFLYAETKKSILEHIREHSDLHIFSEDELKGNKTVKSFFATDYETVYVLSKKKKFHIYENYERDEKIKLFIDIDIKEFPDNINEDVYFDNIINKSIKLFTNKLKEKNVFNPEIIILKSSSETKLSSHIIFNNIIFEDIYHMKHFLSDLDDSKLVKEHTIDLSVYKTGCFRILWNSKLGKGINLEYYRSINYNYVSDKQLFYDCLLKNIPEKHELINIDFLEYKNINDIPEEVDVIQTNKIIHKNYKGIINKIDIDTMKILIDCINDAHFLKYDLWRDILFICFNCNNDDKIVDYLTHRSRIGKYINVSKSDVASQFYSNGYQENFNKLVLYSYARKDNRNNLYDKYFGEHYDEYIFDYNQIDTEYLDYNELNNKFRDTKYCVIKSRYGSGKTTFIKDLIRNKYMNRRIIFLTMRQSLAININKDFTPLEI